MARKAKPPSPQLGLGLSSTPSTAPVYVNPNRVPEGAAVDDRLSPSVDIEDFDDYDDAKDHEGAPRLRLVDPPRDAPTVIVEAVGDAFEVSRLRDNGTTVACVRWTRKELEELQRRIAAALEI